MSNVYQTFKKRSESVDRQITKFGFIALAVLLAVAIGAFVFFYNLNPSAFSLPRVVGSLAFPVAYALLIFHYYNQKRGVSKR
ncbi:MAG: hypothetical protein NWQ54_16035 [Paraglaciecola sp.]|nr:hypothetical protein [Paraglaciecola sp.]